VGAPPGGADLDAQRALASGLDLAVGGLASPAFMSLVPQP